MPNLSFTIQQVEAVPHSVTPLMAFKLGIANVDPTEVIHTICLRCQVQIEAAKRRYGPADHDELKELFGEPERWGQTVRNLQWINTSVVVLAFEGSSTVDVQIPCTFDFAIAITKYFDGLSDGEIPVSMMFSGTVFYRDGEGALQAAPIPWDREARFRFPLKLWKDLMERFYPNNAWLCLRKDVFDELHRYKVQQGFSTWEEALQVLRESARTEAIGS